MKQEILDWAKSQMKKVPAKLQINEIEMSKKQKEMQKKKKVKEFTKVDKQIARQTTVQEEEKPVDTSINHGHNSTALPHHKGSVKDSIHFFE